MLPFERYPQSGRALLGQVSGANCRHDYGLKFMQITGETQCAYCGLDFTAQYENWLTIALDHVVPSSVGNCLQIPSEWISDYANRVLACSACNGFKNRYRPGKEIACPTSLEGFFQLRDTIFAARKELIAKSHAQERAFYDKRLWERRQRRESLSDSPLGQGEVAALSEPKRPTVKYSAELAPNQILYTNDGEITFPEKLEINHDAWTNFLMECQRLAEVVTKREEGRKAGTPCRCGHLPDQHDVLKRRCVEGCKCTWYDP